MAARLLFSLLLLASSHASVASVEETCAKATVGGHHKDLASFCVTSLQVVPGSARASVHGLAVIATNLTLANYTAAVATIKKLQRRGGWSEGARVALGTCQRRYIEVLKFVHGAVRSLATGRTQAYMADMGAVRRAATDCEDAFNGSGSGWGKATAATDKLPLRKVDEDAINLTTVSMLIVLTLQGPFSHFVV